MFKPSQAKTIPDYIAALPADRRETFEFVHKLIKKTVPKLKPFFSYNMPAYGKVQYRNHQNKIIDWHIIALASQKNYFSLYICATEDNQYIAEKYQAELGKVKVGKSCINFKKLEDLDLKALQRILKLAAKSPGLVGAEIVK